MSKEIKDFTVSVAAGVGIAADPAGAGRDVLPQLWHPSPGRTHYQP